MPLLESQIIKTQLTREIVEHWDTWPQLHVNTSKSIKNYEHDYLGLLHDESAYKDLFETEFPPNENHQEGFKL